LQDKKSEIMTRIVLTTIILGLFTSFLQAQGYAFGVKGGLTIGVQQWEGFEQDPLFKYHGIAFIESLPEDNQFALFAQLGYHLKGSAFRSRNAFGLNGNVFRAPAQEFIFRNLSLVLGAKQKFDLFNNDSRAYYLLGIRGDYNLSTNLDEYKDANMVYPIYPDDSKELIREITYGVSLGGGIEFPFSELAGALIEFTINPDFSYQYEQPSATVFVNNQFFTGNVNIPERKIRNLTFELTVGFRFLNKIEYID